MTTTYYVSGSGDDNNNGQSPQAPFRNIQTAADLTQPGDVVYVMDGIYTNSNPYSDIVRITRSGTANAWITYKAYPGTKPKLISNNWQAFAIRGASYITIDGFELQGNNDNITLEQAIAEQNNLNNPLTSGNGISISPSGTQNPHHIIIQNNEVYKFGGGGIYTYHADYVTISNNIVYDNAWYSPYGNSGISTYQNWNSDSYTGYKMIIKDNITYNNLNLVPWYVLGEITEGSGIIIDDSRNTQNNSTLGRYQGRTLVENNFSYNNGGRGISAYESDFVDIVSNRTYLNLRNADADSGEIDLNSTDGVHVLNNIVSPATGKPAILARDSTNVVSDSNIVYGSVGANTAVYSQYVDPVIANLLVTRAQVQSEDEAVAPKPHVLNQIENKVYSLDNDELTGNFSVNIITDAIDSDILTAGSIDTVAYQVNTSQLDITNALGENGLLQILAAKPSNALVAKTLSGNDASEVLFTNGVNPTLGSTDVHFVDVGNTITLLPSYHSPK
jgi:hypothetical protein